MIEPNTAAAANATDVVAAIVILSNILITGDRLVSRLARPAVVVSVLFANGALPPAALADDCLRLNEIQVVGTHNSYHVQPQEPLFTAIRDYNLGLSQLWEYTHLPLDQQLEMGLRQFEIDGVVRDAGCRESEILRHVDIGPILQARSFSEIGIQRDGLLGQRRLVELKVDIRCAPASRRRFFACLFASFVVCRIRGHADRCRAEAISDPAHLPVGAAWAMLGQELLAKALQALLGIIEMGCDLLYENPRRHAIKVTGG